MNDIKYFLYTFFGKVLPERAAVQMPPLKYKIDIKEENISGTVFTSINSSQITAKFITQNEIKNIFSLKNYIEDCIRLQVDILGYLQSCSYDVEITSVSEGGKELSTVFGVNLEDIDKFRKERPKEFNDILKIFTEKKGNYLRLCLGDLREAIRKGKDVGFYCYRAIESLRMFFFKENNCNNKDESWIELRESLDVDRTDIDYIKKYGDITRHGDTKYISGEEYSKILNTTWEIVDKFIIFACNDYKPINDKE